MIKFNFINLYPPAMLAEKKLYQSHEYKLGRNRSHPGVEDKSMQ